MANNNKPDTSNQRNADTVVCESVKVIKNDKNTVNSLEEAYETMWFSKEKAEQYKICCLEKAKKSHDVYQNIMSFTTIGSYKKSEIIQKSIDTYSKQDDAIEKLIKDSSKLINQMRLKMEDAHNAACAMSNCIKNKVKPISGKKAKGGHKTGLEEDLSEILVKTRELDEKGQNAFQSVVTIAGIQTFTNTSSLKEYGSTLVDTVNDFKTCVENNIKSTEKDVSVSREELNTVAEELSEVICSKYTQSTIEKGLENTLQVLCKKDFEDETLDLCRDITCSMDNGHGEEAVRRNAAIRRKQTDNQD